MFQAPEPNTDNPNVPEIKEDDDGSSGKEKNGGFVALYKSNLLIALPLTIIAIITVSLTIITN